MPLVFVHGVATRTSQGYERQEKERDKLFARLLMGNKDAKIFNPHWGDLVQKPAWDLKCVPDYDVKYERYGIPGAPSAPLAGVGADDPLARFFFARVAKRDFAEAADLLFASTLAAIAADNETPDDEFLALTEALTRYLAANWHDLPVANRTSPNWLRDNTTNEEFANNLLRDVKATMGGVQTEAYGAGDILKGVGKGLKRVVDIVRNKVSRAVLAAGRDGATHAVALFIGDVFGYLRDRPHQPSKRTEIRAEILKDLVAAGALRKKGDNPLIVVGHSMGAVILYDMFSDPAVKAHLRSKNATFTIDAFVSVGSQVALFEEMKLHTVSNPNIGGNARVPYPFDKDFVQNWLNVFDDTDPLSFLCEEAFEGVEDYRFSSETGLLSAHTAYFTRPSFFERSRARLRDRDVFT